MKSLLTLSEERNREKRHRRRERERHDAGAPGVIRVVHAGEPDRERQQQDRDEGRIENCAPSAPALQPDRDDVSSNRGPDADGGDQLDLVPRDWLVNPKFLAWGTGPAPGGRVAIAIFGSYGGVKPLIERYRAIASEIDYPAPTRWNKQSSPAEDRLGTLLMIFDRAQFEAASTQLKSSPQTEMMTPFLATDFRR